MRGDHPANDTHCAVENTHFPVVDVGVAVKIGSAVVPVGNLCQVRPRGTNRLPFGAMATGSEVIGNLVPRDAVDPRTEALGAVLPAKTVETTHDLDADVLRQVFPISRRKASFLGRFSDMPRDGDGQPSPAIGFACYHLP